jgi:AcrR family transcriptional regulator
MARPINADASRTRAALLSVAIEHFGRDGFRKATTRKIAGDVGVSFATLHHYFGTKEALFAECIEKAFDELLEIGAQVAVVLSTPPTEDRVRRAVRHGYRVTSASPSRSRFLMRAFVFEDQELVAKHVPEHRNRLFDGALTLLQTGVDEETAEKRRVRFIGIGMLLTRFAAASSFERGLLGEQAFAHGGAIEDYLVQIAEATLGKDVLEPSQLQGAMRD